MRNNHTRCLSYTYIYFQRCRIDLCDRQPWYTDVIHWSQYIIRTQSTHTRTWGLTSPALATTYSVTREQFRIILLNPNNVVSLEPQQTPRRSWPLNHRATPKTSTTMSTSFHHEPHPSDARHFAKQPPGAHEVYRQQRYNQREETH